MHSSSLGHCNQLRIGVKSNKLLMESPQFYTNNIWNRIPHVLKICRRQICLFPSALQLNYKRCHTDRQMTANVLHFQNFDLSKSSSFFCSLTQLTSSTGSSSHKVSISTRGRPLVLKQQCCAELLLPFSVIETNNIQ